MSKQTPRHPGMVLEELVLGEQTRLTLAAAILRALEAAFGPQAGIVFDDPSWGLVKKGPRGARTFRVGTFGTIAVPRGVEGAAFARVLAARLTDFEALEHVRERAARLAMLYQAENEFGAELHLDRTLEMIVQRGRALTGADICYLSLLGTSVSYCFRFSLSATICFRVRRNVRNSNPCLSHGHVFEMSGA